MKPDLPTGHLVPAQRIGLAPYCGASLPGPPTALPPESASSVGGSAADPASRRSSNLHTATVLGLEPSPVEAAGNLEAHGRSARLTVLLHWSPRMLAERLLSINKLSMKPK